LTYVNIVVRPLNSAFPTNVLLRNFTHLSNVAKTTAAVAHAEKPFASHAVTLEVC
jgi:hypothetical protein